MKDHVVCNPLSPGRPTVWAENVCKSLDYKIYSHVVWAIEQSADFENVVVWTWHNRVVLGWIQHAAEIPLRRVEIQERLQFDLAD